MSTYNKDYVKLIRYVLRISIRRADLPLPCPAASRTSKAPRTQQLGACWASADLEAHVEGGTGGLWQGSSLSGSRAEYEFLHRPPHV